MNSNSEHLSSTGTWLGSRYDLPASAPEFWDIAPTKSLSTISEAIIQSILLKSDNVFNFESSPNVWKTLLDTCECWGSLHSRKMQLILASVSHGKLMPREHTLLSVLRMIDDLTPERDFIYQPEQDALYSSIYLKTVKDLVEDSHLQASSGNCNAFIAKSLLEVWQLNLLGAGSETHEQYLTLILKLKPCKYLDASLSPNVLKPIYGQAFRLLTAPSDLVKDTPSGSISGCSSIDDIVKQLLDLLFRCHRLTNTLSRLLDYDDIIGFLLLNFLKCPPAFAPATLISAILTRTLRIAERTGLHTEFIASLANWMLELELPPGPVRHRMVVLVRGSLHLFLEDWEEAQDCCLIAQKVLVTDQKWNERGIGLFIDSLLEDVVARRCSSLTSLQLNLVSSHAAQA